MASVRSTSSVAPVGFQDLSANPSAVNLPAPTGLAAGDAYIVAVWAAQGPGTTSAYPSSYPGLTQVSVNGTSDNRLLIIFAGVVTNPATHDTVNIRIGATSTRVVATGIAVQPSSGHHFDMSGIVCSGPNYNMSSASSINLPSVSGDMQLGFVGTNNSSTSTHPTHSSVGGSIVRQDMARGAVSDPTADSVLSVSNGGTSVSMSVATANQIAYTIGIAEVEDSLGIEYGDASAGTVSVWDGSDELPVTQVIGLPVSNQSYTVSEMEQDIANNREVFWGHRGGSLNWSEMSMRAYTNCIFWGCKAPEISAHRSSDGVWIMSHDGDLTRVTATAYPIVSTPSSTLLGTPIDAPTTGGVIGRIEAVLDAYKDLLLIIDNKPGSFQTEFFDLVKAHVPDWAEHVIIKIDGASSVSRFQAAQAAGFKTAAYWYDSSNWATIPGKIPYVDYPGLNYDAAQSYWDDLIALAGGKPMWGHVLPSPAAKNTAKTKGANIFQCSNITGIIPKINDIV